MPTPEEEQEHEAFEREVAEHVGPTDPEALFKLGQLSPHAASVVDAIRELMPQPDAGSLAVMNRAFDDSRPRPFSGAFVAPEELEAVKAEQIPATPTHERQAGYSGDFTLLDSLNWHFLDAINDGRAFLRGAQGQGLTFHVQEVPIAAFLTAILLPVPPWTVRHVFAERAKNNKVRFLVGYTQPGTFPGSPTPEWVTRAAEALPSIYRETNRSGNRIE